MRYIAGIDILRFLGAASVVWLHLGSLTQLEAVGLKKFHVLVSGSTGVMLFYVISGFLITSIISAEVQKTGSFSLKSFFIRRILRIFPLYYTVLLIYALISISGIQTLKFESFQYALFYAYNFIPKRLYDGWLGSFHTLATEEHFYIIYPLLWAICLRHRFRLAVILALGIVSTFLTMKLSAPFAAHYFIGRWTFNAWAPILIGCLFGLYYSSRDKDVHRWTPLFLLGFLALYIPQAWFRSEIAMSAAFGLLILYISYNQRNRFVAALGSPVGRFLGNISYGMYVWQSLVISTGPGRRLISDPLLAVVTVLILSSLSWILLEKPLTRLRKRMQRTVTNSGGSHSDSGATQGATGSVVP